MIVQDGKNNCLFCDVPDVIRGTEHEVYSKSEIVKRVRKMEIKQGNEPQ